MPADRASAARRLPSRGRRWEVCEQAGRTSSAIATLNLSVIIDQNTPIYGQLARAYEKLMGFPTPPVVRGLD